MPVPSPDGVPVSARAPPTSVGSGSSNSKRAPPASACSQSARMAARPRVSCPGGKAMTASSSYRAARPSASPALARSTTSRVRSSGVRAGSAVVIAASSGWGPPPRPSTRHGQQSNSCIGWDLASARMELRQLEYLVAVVEEGGFTRAAERVHVSQSGVSAQVRQLERELGQVLLDRTTRRVALTPAGAAVLPHARAALAAVAGARQAADDLGGLVTGQVAVGMVTGCALPGLFEALAAFTRAHPGVRLSLTEGASDEMTRDVRAGDLDLAVVGAFGAPLPGTERVV